ncbi:MAG: hypothetical protein WC769_00465 [Thermodesulfovibrionales bacterium]|jgi:hypothetical protein
MKNSCEEAEGITDVSILKFTDSGKLFTVWRFSGVKRPIAYRQLLSCLCLLMSLILLPLSLAQANDFTAWTDSISNPLFGGAVDKAYYPCVIKVGSVYHIWYGDGSHTRHANSINFDFSGVTFPAPIVTGLSAAGPYHPRVLYNASGWNIGGTPYAGPFLMYYTDGTTWTSTRVAHSADGNSWTDIGLCNGVHLYSGGVIYNFDVLYEGGTTWKAYADNGGGQIEYYISTDGINWTGTAHNILGTLQAWETWFTSPHVIKSGSQYVMYYGSGGAGSNQGIGVAFSTDGQNFAKSSSNPIFSTSGAPSWRNDRTYTPYVIPDGTSWIMYYTGRSTAGVYSVGYALPTQLPPAGSITINSGDVSTNSTAVTLALSCSDSSGCSQMCLSNTSGCSSWESYSSTKAWTLTSGAGTKTVYAWFNNSVGNANTSPFSDSIVLDTSIPTPGGANVTVTFPNGATITYDNIASNCSTNLIVVATPDHNPPSKFRLIRGAYFDIATNCSYSGNITITMPYDPTDVQGGENKLKLFHWKNNGWKDCTVSVNTASNTITGRVTSLSPFGIGDPISSGSSGSGSTYSTGANENMIALIAVLAILPGVFILRKNRWHGKA